MKKVVIIVSRSGFNDLEQQVNEFLVNAEKKSNKVNVLSIGYADNSSYASALIFYEEKPERRV